MLKIRLKTMPMHNWGLSASRLYIKFGDKLKLSFSLGWKFYETFVKELERISPTKTRLFVLNLTASEAKLFLLQLI